MTDDQLPDRRKHGYAELEEKLDNHAQALDDRLRAFFLKALIGFAVIGVTSAVALFGFGFAIHEINDTRSDFVREECQSTNERHDNTVARLDDLMPKDTTTEGEKAKAATIALIDALAPVQDCVQLVKIANGDATPTPVETTKPTRKP